MKNLTTLSLITATIIGLTGCGGDSSSTLPATTTLELSSIQKLSETSTKYQKTDWLEIQNYIQDLDNTEGFDTMLLANIDKNIANLTYVGVDKEEAYAVNADLMYEDLINLNIENLDNQVVAECKEDETCKEEAYASLSVNLAIDKEEAYAIATEIDKGSETPSTLNNLLEKFTCESGLVRKVQYYGVEDNFSTANGTEEANASTQVQNNAGVLAYNNGIGLSNYDTTQVNRQFAEEIKNLPANISSGHFYIGLQNHGSNDRITIGNMDSDASTLDFFGEDVLDLNPNLSWNKTGTVHDISFSNIALRDGSDLKTYVQNHNNFDVYVQDDTYVDFIAVATCAKPDPIKEISGIVNKFECSEKETLVKLFGGTLDAFNPTTDSPATPSSNLETIALGNTVYPSVADYDHTAFDYHFVETLNLGLSSGQNITKAEFNIGYKVIGSSLYSNDRLYMGDINGSAGNYVGADLYGTSSLNRFTIPSYGYLVKEDLLALSNNSAQATGTVGATMINKGKLDVYVQDDTAVDFTQLNLCMTDNCDKDAKDIELDLSQLASWTFKPADAIENNVFNGTQYEGVWDNTLNWFDFNNAKTDEILEIPFCACGDTIVNIEHLKADNLATVKLDATLVASQTANGQDAMKRDDLGGVHEEGNLTVVAGTNGGTDHVLRVDVHNLSSDFGVAIDGTLKFRGNLGKCQ